MLSLIQALLRREDGAVPLVVMMFAVCGDGVDN